MASNVIGDLAVRVGADTRDFTKGMDKAKRQLNQLSNEAKTGTKVIAGYATAATAAGTALAIGLGLKASSAAKEVSNLSKVSNASTTEFQQMAFAAKTVGIEQEKLADIFKDMNDRVGDFITTGAGPMADFFEQIAPAVGVTAEEFKKLSGPQALQLYVNTLEKANLSQQEMTFFMEQIASDSTALLPLLKNNAEGFRAQADEAEALGIILSELDIQAMEEMANQLDRTSDIFDVFTGKVTGQLAPAVSALNELFLDTVTEMGGIDEASERMANNILDATGFVLDAVEGVKRSFEVAGKSIAVFGLGVGETMLAVADFILNRPVQAVNEFIDILNQLPGVDVTPVGLSTLGETVQDQLQLTRMAVKEGIEDIQNTLMQPMPSTQFEDFVAQAQEANEKVLESNNNRRAQELEAQDAFDTILRQAVQEAGEWHTQFEKEQAEARAAIAEQEAAAREAATSQMFSDLSSLMNSESRKMFNIGKAAAISEAVISTISSAQKAFESLAGIPIIGPSLGAAAAGAAIAAGTARVSAIRSRQFSSSGGVSAGAGGGGSSSSAATNSAVTGGSVETRQTRFVEGISPGEFVTRETLAELLNEQYENGARYVFT